MKVGDREMALIRVESGRAIVTFGKWVLTVDGVGLVIGANHDAIN